MTAETFPVGLGFPWAAAAALVGSVLQRTGGGGGGRRGACVRDCGRLYHYAQGSGIVELPEGERCPGLVTFAPHQAPGWVSPCGPEVQAREAAAQSEQARMAAQQAATVKTVAFLGVVAVVAVAMAKGL